MCESGRKTSKCGGYTCTYGLVSRLGFGKSCQAFEQ